MFFLSRVSDDYPSHTLGIANITTLGFLLTARETSTTNQPDHDSIRSIPKPHPTADRVTIQSTNDFETIENSPFQTKSHGEQARKRRRNEENEPFLPGIDQEIEDLRSELSDVERLQRSNERAVDIEKEDTVVDKGASESCEC